MEKIKAFINFSLQLKIKEYFSLFNSYEALLNPLLMRLDKVK